jgi:hypothetical protein
MAKVGQFVTDPKAGAYCQIKLDSGERILVSHDRGGFAGGTMTIQEVRLWGLAPGAVLFRFDLEGDMGRRVLARLIQGAPATSARATPLGAFVQYLQDCPSLDDVRMKCAALELSSSPPAA